MVSGFLGLNNINFNYRIKGDDDNLNTSSPKCEKNIYYIKGVINVNDVYEAICSVACGSTDFDVGFDSLFEFMKEHAQSTTTKRFIAYHMDN